MLGAWAVILHQRAYIRAPLQASLPALSVAAPLAGIAFGAMAFGEVPAGRPLAMLGEAAGMAVSIVAVAVLGRLSAAPGRHRRGKAHADTDPRRAPNVERCVPLRQPPGAEPPAPRSRGSRTARQASRPARQRTGSPDRRAARIQPTAPGVRSV